MPTSRVTGAAGSKLGGVAGCHRVRRRHTRYVFIGYHLIDGLFFDNRQGEYLERLIVQNIFDQY